MQATYTLPEHLQVMGGMTALACTGQHKFAVASGMAKRNELQVLQYVEEQNKVVLSKSYQLGDQSVQCLSGAPTNERILASAFMDNVTLFELSEKELTNK
jgi:hypothetical protein